jgi:glycosyltransferase involved in cell wall biosynthesis
VNKAIPVAFYAPLKSPHHPSPSGDRTMARLLMKALQAAGFDPTLASSLRSFEPSGELLAQERLRAQSAAEADRLIGIYQDTPISDRPRLWFTYHVYYKAPDWIGPRVADALGVPYVIAEGSRAGKRAGGPWALGHAGAEAALERANVVFVMTSTDREALERRKPAAQCLSDLPPFIDLTEWAGTGKTSPRRNLGSGIRFLTVAMMRPGDKFASYKILADTLAQLRRAEWILDIVGDGDARPDVEQMFLHLGERVRFHGLIEDRATLAKLYAEADLFLWPAVNEAYGMVLLEAQAFGCPVVAGAYGGVASVVRDGETGILTPPGNADAVANAVGMILGDRERRLSLGAAARRFVSEERGLQRAAERLRASLVPLVTNEKCR